jgi:hypothetical protein
VELKVPMITAVKSEHNKEKNTAAAWCKVREADVWSVYVCILRLDM